MANDPSPLIPPLSALRTTLPMFLSRRFPRSRLLASTTREPGPNLGASYGVPSPKALLSLGSPAGRGPERGVPRDTWDAFRKTAESALITPPEATLRSEGISIKTGPEKLTLPPSLRLSKPPPAIDSRAKNPLAGSSDAAAAAIRPSSEEIWAATTRFSSLGLAICPSG